MRERLEEAGYSNVEQGVRMLKRIRDEMSVGDIVIVEDGEYIYAVGVLVKWPDGTDLKYERSPPLFYENRPYPHEPYFYPYKRRVRSVSYTHLTLPTTERV